MKKKIEGQKQKDKKKEKMPLCPCPFKNLLGPKQANRGVIVENNNKMYLQFYGKIRYS